jgi:DNA polymerase I-like protein with 3'-5' exonuclease and polymerase domains
LNGLRVVLELDAIKEVAHEVVCIDLPKEWDWIIVPLEVEIGSGKNWLEAH